MIALLLLAQGTLPSSLLSVEPTTLACQFERLDQVGKFAGTDRLAVFLPKGIGSQSVANVELRDPAGLMRGGNFDSIKLLPTQGIFALHGSGWPLMVLTVQSEKHFGTNAILGPVDMIAPTDNTRDRNGICRIISRPDARRRFEEWAPVPTFMERGR